MNFLKVGLLVGALVLAGGATQPNWNNTVVETDAGHRIGNPEAKLQLTEFVSYTCPHCAHFADEGDPVLKILYVHTGKVAVEIRHFLRDPVDLTAALMAQCGEPSRFALNHSALMASQSKWLPLMGSASPAQIQRWTNPDPAAARRAIASDFGFYKMMEGRGYRVTDLDKCISDNARAMELAKATRADAQKFGIRGTPSFAINGKLLEHVHSWDALKPQIDTKLAENSAN